MKEIKIEHRTINKNTPCFIISEAGINHNGDIALAKKLVDIAQKAGSDAVKFQTYTTENVAIENANIADYAKENIGKSMKQREMLKKYELDFNDFLILKKYCDKKKIIFLSTPHSYDAIDILEDLVPAYKIASADLTNFPLLKYAASKQKAILLGTGMATLREISQAADLIKSQGNDQIIPMHCTTNYPCPLKEVNLRALTTMQKELDLFIGYSDHTLGFLVPIMAFSMGAVVIEKHITLDRSMEGPDHSASLEPHELKEMIDFIRKAEEALGSPLKKPTKNETSIKNIARKSLVANMPIMKNSVLTEGMIAVKRPGMGISPQFFESIIGKKITVDLRKDDLIRWEFLE